jgi:hypothetical protein
MRKVKYCSIYNDICTRSWCQTHKGCGAGGSSEVVTKYKAKRLIAERKRLLNNRSIRRALELVINNLDILKKMGYRIQVTVLKTSSICICGKPIKRKNPMLCPTDGIIYCETCINPK